MSIDTVHPLYTDMLDLWTLAEDSYDGEKAIKTKTTTYLPATSGQREDGQGKRLTKGQAAYDAYILRAHYPDIFSDAVDAIIGIMHRKPPTIELPDSMAELETNATLLGESLELVLRAINTQQWLTGRLGLLADIRTDTDNPMPVLLMYGAKAIRNWDDTSVLNDDLDARLVVLDESGYAMESDLTWVHKNRYRLLGLAGDNGQLDYSGVYGTYLFEETDSAVTGVQLEVPNFMGSTLDNAIPFSFINACDLSPTPGNPPLIGLANLCLTIYRGEADYRQNLFMQGQDTLVTVGGVSGIDGDEDLRTGAGARIDCQLGGDAKYIGVSSQGLPEQRTALENDYKRAINKSGQVLNDSSGGAESGEALRIRVAARTATLPLVAKTGAAGLERVLKIIAKWQGADPDQVVVKPNLEFTEADLNGQTLVQILQAKGLGAPISYKSIHSYMAEQGFTRKTFDEESEEIAEEAPGADIPSSIINDLPNDQAQ